MSANVSVCVPLSIARVVCSLQYTRQSGEADAKVVGHVGTRLALLATLR